MIANTTIYCLLPTTTYFLLPCLLPIAYCLLPIAYYLLPTIYCLLPIALMPAAYWPLTTDNCLLPTTYCLLSNACCLLLTTCCLQPAACYEKDSSKSPAIHLTDLTVGTYFIHASKAVVLKLCNNSYAPPAVLQQLAAKTVCVPEKAFVNLCNVEYSNNKKSIRALLHRRWWL